MDGLRKSLRHMIALTAVAGSAALMAFSVDAGPGKKGHGHYESGTKGDFVIAGGV